MPDAIPIDADELEALRRDAARLNFLEDTSRTYWVTVQVQPDGKHIRSGQGAGLRIAIDAAMSSAPECEPDDEQHEPMCMFGFGEEYETERYLDDRERAKDINKER